MISEDDGISIVDAVKEVYSSDVYLQLEEEKTKMWTLGPVALYESMKHRTGERHTVCFRNKGFDSLIRRLK